MNKQLPFPALKLCCAVLLVCAQSLLLAQRGSKEFAPVRKISSASTSTLATSYTATACGLDFTQASVRLNQRSFGFTPPKGVTQPATLSVSGLPSGCATIVKAFLYVGVAGDGIAITPTLTNPANTSSTCPMTIVGRDIDLCWGYDSTYTYRADVTGIINGNGNYVISGVPVSTAVASQTVNDADGATLFIIYSDPQQNYTGSIVIADGCQAMLGGSYVGSNITGFNVCANPTLTTCFMLLADLQQLDTTKISFNTPGNLGATPNFTKLATTDNVWDYVSGPGTPPVSGQSNANFGMYNSGDCVGLLMAGMYYRTSCLSCVPTGTAPYTLSVTTTPGCLASATVMPVGSSGPFTYYWSGTTSPQTGSIITNQPPGTYTVSVSDLACHTTTAEVVLTSATVGVIYTSPMCKGETRQIIVQGSASINYTWTGNSIITSMTAHTPTAYINPTQSSVYTVSFSTGPGCTVTKTISITVLQCAGIEELTGDADGLMVYPNPARDKITISAKKGMTLQLINALGQCVRTVTLKEENNFEMTLTGLSKGVYYLTNASGNKTSFERKVVIE